MKIGFPRTGLLLALALLSPASPAFSGVNLWTPSGPDGGIVNVIANDPTSSSIVYAGIHTGGIWKSTDAAGSWKAIGTDRLAAADVTSIAVSRSLPTTIYAATSDQGAFRSTDGGTTWAAINTGFNNVRSTGFPDVSAIAVDPTHSSIAYAGGPPFAAGTGGIFKTTDGGAHWNPSNTGLPLDSPNFSGVSVIRINTTDASDIFAATDGTGVYRSTNSGATWSKFCDDSIDGQSTSSVYPVSSLNAVFSVAGETLYRSSTSSSPLASLVEDFDQPFWNNVSDALGRLLMHYPFLFHPNAIDELSMGPASLGPGGQTVSIPDFYVSSTDAGMAKSTDGASTWELINNGIPSLDLEALSTDPIDVNVVYTGGQGDGIYKTTSGGSSWTAASHGLTATHVTAMAVATSNSSVVYAGLSAAGGVRKSTDGGASWSFANGGILGNLAVSSLAADPVDAATVYAVASGYIGESFTHGAYKSTDGGSHWTAINNGVDGSETINYLAVARSNGSVLYGSSVSFKSYKSTDAGATWKEMTAATNVVSFATGLAIDPTSASTVFVATAGNGIFRSTDGGASWIAVNNVVGLGSLQSATVLALAIDPAHPATVYAGVSGGGMYKTTDSGAHWENSLAGLQDNASGETASPNGIVIDPADSKTVYLSSSDNPSVPDLANVAGAFVSHDSGQTWTRMNAGLSNLHATGLAFASAGASSTIYFGTNGGGIHTFAIVGPPKPRQAGGITAFPIGHTGKRP